MEIRIGCVIKGRWNKKSYLIEKKLGEGGLGSVYLVKCTNNGKRYAIKVFEDIMSAAREYKLLNEFSYLIYLPQVFELDDIESDNVSFIVMEYIEGFNLNQFEKSHRLSVKSILGIGVIFLKIIKEFHLKGYVLGDIKPENIMIDNRKKIIRVVDIGGITKIGSGIKEYTPQFDRASWDCGVRKADEKYDIFGLGMLMADLLLGKRVSPSKKMLMKILNEVKDRSNEIYDIVYKCIAGNEIDEIFENTYRFYNSYGTKTDFYINFALVTSVFFLFLFLIIWYNV